MGSILRDIKERLGLDPDAVGFDSELVGHINSVISNFDQLGVGPNAGYAISGPDETWEDFLGSDPRLNDAKSLAFLQVKMLFDPPTIGFLISAYEKAIEKTEWRLTVHSDGVGTVVLTGGHTSVIGNEGDEQNIRLTNPSGQTLINASGSYEAVFVSSAGRESSVALDVSQASSGVLVLPIVIQNGRYIVRLLSPRRTILTVEVSTA